MKTIQKKILEATKNILEKNLKILEKPYCNNEIILVYDLESELSKIISNAYIKNLKQIKNSKSINIAKIDKKKLIKRLRELKKNSTVVLVQSTNFRLDNFRIRLQLHNNNVGCLEHNHLIYMKNDQIETYINSIKYLTPYYNKLGLKLKKLSNNAKTKTFICNDGSRLYIEGGFDDMKINTGDYEGKKRGSTLPVGENFTESSNFALVNGELSILIYPGMDFKIKKSKQLFKLKINKSIITCDDKNVPKEFLELLELIKSSENNEVMMRELGFGLNPNITNKNILSDVNFFERKAGFHISIGKKHQIYRKKLDKSVVQRYHIDIFPDIKEIYIDNLKIFKNNKYII